MKHDDNLTMVLLKGSASVCSAVPKSASVVALLARILSNVGRLGDLYYVHLRLDDLSIKIEREPYLNIIKSKCY